MKSPVDNSSRAPCLPADAEEKPPRQRAAVLHKMRNCQLPFKLSYGSVELDCTSA